MEVCFENGKLNSIAMLFDTLSAGIFTVFGEYYTWEHDVAYLSGVPEPFKGFNISWQDNSSLAVKGLNYI